MNQYLVAEQESLMAFPGQRWSAFVLGLIQSALDSALLSQRDHTSSLLKRLTMQRVLMWALRGHCVIKIKPGDRKSAGCHRMVRR